MRPDLALAARRQSLARRIAKRETAVLRPFSNFLAHIEGPAMRSLTRRPPNLQR
jgi:hypothetical protein